MAVRFVIGGPGTGKTTLVLREIRKKISAGENTPLYYLVPEQFSLQAERLLLVGGRDAVTQVQVLSFNRLAYRFFSVLGQPLGKHVDELGKQMLLRKVLFEISADLEYYKSAADKHGFVEELAHTITEMNHYRVSAEDLILRAEHSPAVLAAKLRDTALILSKYRKSVTGRYLLTDEMPDLLCKKMSEIPLDEPLPLLDGAVLWVDGFSGFTPQERQVLLHIMKRAELLTMTLTIKDSLSQMPRETMEKLENAANSAKISILPYVHLKKNFRHENAPALSHFVENYSLNAAILGFYSSQNNIEIISASDRYSAVYAAAQKTLFFVRENGLKFRDIAILCGNRSYYEKILQNVFDRENIPLFVDTEADILSHPLTEMIRSVLDIFVKNWNYESVFRFLKTRLAGLEPDTIDILENYALANGIESYRWRYPFNNEQAENGRKQLLAALAPFEKTRADSADTVRNHARRVFDMLYLLDVPNVLQTWFEKNMLEGSPAIARLHAQIWPKLCEVFDKYVEILGEEKVTHKIFAATLDAGLCQVGLGRVPPTVDQIVLGDISRSRYPQIKAMIVLGANDGSLPPAPTDTGLFTDYERKNLRNSALELAPENFRRISEQNYNLYCALSQPSEKLVFIYAEAEPNGKPLRPSPVLGKIRKMFPNLPTTPAPAPSEKPAENSVFFAPFALSETSVNQLYGQTIYTSATCLEAFARCPFAYYMNYILGAKPRKHYEVLPTDLGGLFHDVIAGFTKHALGSDFNFSRAEIENIINALVSGLDTENSIFHSTARNKHILNKVRRVAAASCWALCEQIKRGKYRPAMIEQEILANISLEGGKNLAVSGRVDRVDISESGSVRIIDYKTGGGKFNMDEALKGVQLQLVLYMNEILKSRKPAIPGGVFYFPVSDPIFDADGIIDDIVREEGLLKCFKMSGLEVDDLGKNLDANAFLQFSRDVESTVKQISKRMAQGEIAAEAYTKGQKSPCNYCRFEGVCGKT